MRRLFVWILLWIWVLPLGAQNLLSGGEISASPGATGIPLEINLTNTAPVAGVQFDLVLIPEAVADSLRQVERGLPLNTLTFSRLGDTLRVILFSFPPDSILPGSGPILRIFLTLASAAPPGTFTLPLLHAALSDPQGNNLPVNTVPAQLIIQGMALHENPSEDAAPRRIRIFDPSGRLRACLDLPDPPSLLQGTLPAYLPNGIYWVEMHTGGRREVRKVWIIHP